MADGFSFYAVAEISTTKGIKVSYMKCNALPTFNVTIGKKHKMRIALDSGAAHFCTVSSSILNKWENTDKDFKNCKSFEKMVSESYICDTTLVKRKARGYKCDFAIKSFIIKDAVVIENRPDHIDSIGEDSIKLPFPSTPGTGKSFSSLTISK